MVGFTFLLVLALPTPPTLLRDPPLTVVVVLLIAVELRPVLLELLLREVPLLTEELREVLVLLEREVLALLRLLELLEREVLALLRLLELPEREAVAEGQVPDVKGLGVMDAVYEIENRGWRCVWHGTGHVRSQSPAAGTRLAKGNTVTLELK